MQIDRLRLVGFKSFADATEVAIGPGLTGIVGPNGCGKSNLAEALRWVMGENSARRLRGGAMDEVIFGGAAARPARNVAEVALTLDNSAGDAPFPFNDREEIEIVRRIERGVGSSWQINGHMVRARDVQLLFADAATGGPSGAIVSQGHVGALIQAKPAERRFLLEEAAGTAGLHARRRETELKLAVAEDNLGRVTDLIASLAGRLDTLQKQTRQAQRYRRLGEQIRRHEALLFYARWLAAECEAKDRHAELVAAESRVIEAEARAATDKHLREMAEAALPPLRHAEAEAAAELQRLTHRRDALERELVRIVAARREADRRLAELVADADRENTNLTDAEAALTLLGEERAAHITVEAECGSARGSAEDRRRETDARLAQSEAALRQATEEATAAEAQRGVLTRRHREIIERRNRIVALHADAADRRKTLAAAGVPAEAAAAAAAALAEANERAESWRAALETAQREIAAREPFEAAARDEAHRASALLTRVEAEAEALSALVAPARDTGAGVPVLAEIHVAEGFEAAVGAAFEDELSAPLGEDGGAGQYWVDLGRAGIPSTLPDGAHGLCEVVTAPPALDRSLALVGWIEDAESGRSLQRNLTPGQRLVDRDGCLWRWDGFVRLAGRSSETAQHLRHKNRLTVLAGEIRTAAADAQAAEKEAADATTARRVAAESGRLAREQLGDAEARLHRARAATEALAHRALTIETQLAAAGDAVDKLAIELDEAQTQADNTQIELTALPEARLVRAALEAARAAVSQARREAMEAQSAIERLTRESHSRGQRLLSIDREEQSWHRRADGSARQRAILVERKCVVEREIAALAARPAEIARQMEVLVGETSTAAELCRGSADLLKAGERRSSDAADNAHRADQIVAEARERRARLEVHSDGAKQALTGLAREIRERIDAEPGALLQIADLAVGEALGDPAEIAARLARLVRERDGIGPINLVAESEAAELKAQTDALERERADLSGAIAKLRHAGAALDQEGRQLLAAAFEQLNQHFAGLFARLFGGGAARLELTDGGDLLAAGVEIMASPTGKRLQNLSLMSGGEQALTALALLFAVFMTKPAPICILDEVDAPLDDANVNRLCSLAAEIAAATGTRFLLVTHHRITMARADRLFGVTMAEPGVSQLVSVDLARAVQLRRTA
ncbi:MAG TPA: chromosome segregation protein SMC [Stellaceae bacterium]|nr:chromosome segregation protein SMC [Stellaceae bacterium]